MEEYALTLEDIQEQEKQLEKDKIKKLVKIYKILLKEENFINEENIESLVMKNLFELKKNSEYRLNPELIYDTIQFFSNKKNKRILINELLNNQFLKE